MKVIVTDFPDICFKEQNLRLQLPFTELGLDLRIFFDTYLYVIRPGFFEIYKNTIYNHLTPNGTILDFTNYLSCSLTHLFHQFEYHDFIRKTEGPSFLNITNYHFDLVKQFTYLKNKYEE
jgi:hypothetical protein